MGFHLHVESEEQNKRTNKIETRLVETENGCRGARGVGCWETWVAKVRGWRSTDWWV